MKGNPMTNGDAQFPQRRARATEYCREYIQWYERTKRSHRLGYQAIQISASVLSIAAPLLVLTTKTKTIPAVAVAALSLITNLDHIFQPKDMYLRFAQISEMLKNELLKYETRTTEKYALTVDDQEALDNFVFVVSILTTSEVSAWRSQLQ
jgi:hypothetical protein